MIKEAIGTGSTVEEAREDAIAKLGASIDEDIQFEIVATPKKKTFGLFGGSPAKVRVFVELPDPVIHDHVVKEKAARKPAAKAPEKQKPAPKPQKNITKTTQPKQTAATESKAVETKIVPASQIAADSKTGRALSYIEKIFKALDINDINMQVSEIEGGAQISLEGEGLGVIIGRRGETLDSLQYLASLAANARESGYYRIVINIGNYREKREKTLQSLARRIAGQVLKSGRSRALEPMNPYERRIIHTEIQNMQGVVSNSVGDGSNRRVVIGLPNRSDRAPRYQDRRPQQRTQPTKPINTNTDKPVKKDLADTPLYGRIDK